MGLPKAMQRLLDIQDKEFAVCLNCTNFRDMSRDGFNADIWYSHGCAAHPIPMLRNHYDGKMYPGGHSHNNLYEFCQDYNHDGKCIDFVAISVPKNGHYSTN